MKRVLVGLLAAVALLGCGGAKKAETKTLTLGALLDLTGDFAGTGSEEFQAAQMAMEEINAKGGVLGNTQLALTVQDDGTDAAKGKLAAQALVDAHVPVVFGPITSGVALAAGPILAQNHTVLIASTATSPAISDLADDGYVMRTIPSDSLQAAVLANRARTSHHFDRVAIVYLPNTYGRGLEAAFREKFVAKGGTITRSVEYQEGKTETDYSAMLAQVYSNPAQVPQAVVLLAYPTDGGKIMRAYVNGYAAHDTFWFFTDGVQDQDGFVGSLGASNVVFQHEGTGAGSPVGARFSNYKAAYKARWGAEVNVGNGGANVYDGVYLAALAINAAGKTDGMAIRDALGPVSKGGTVFGPENYEQAAKAAAAGEDIDYDGVSGAVDFDAKGDVVAGFDIWKIINGRITPVESSVQP